LESIATPARDKLGASASFKRVQHASKAKKPSQLTVIDKKKTKRTATDKKEKKTKVASW
jgi:hypothetical protein